MSLWWQQLLLVMLGGALGMIVTYGVGTLFNVPA